METELEKLSYLRGWNAAIEEVVKVATDSCSGPEYGRPHIAAKNETCRQVAEAITALTHPVHQIA